MLTCDQDHNYNDEQKAFDGGQMDKFVTTVGTGTGKSGTGQPCSASDVMNYYDGNTVTGLWNYAQHFAMSDNSFGTTFGPSAPGAINLVSGDTGGVGTTINGADTDGDTVPDGNGGLSLIEDAQPYYDDCSTRDAAALTGQNIGDELNAAGLSWGWFQGGFRPTTTFATADRRQPQPTSTFTPDQFKGKFAARAGIGPGPVQRGAPGRRSHRRHRRHRRRADELRQQGRLHRPPRAVPVLRVDGQPAPPGRRRRWPRSAPTRRPSSAASRSSTPPTTSTTPATSTRSSGPSRTATSRPTTCRR